MSTPKLPPTVAAHVPTELLIDGVWRPAASGRRFEVSDPATTQVLFEVADAGPEDALAALAAADCAREEWRA
ncbi:MAG TPA: aldehyde dehydrogenase family protein, partial [Cellulomonas sp.]